MELPAPSHSVRRPRWGAPLQPQVFPPRPILRPAFPEPQSPDCLADRRSLRFLQTPRRTLPSLPPPALGLQSHGRRSAWPGVLPGRNLYQARNPDPGNPRRRGSAASRAALERAAAPRQKPGPRSLSLGSEKRRENFGRNFANFALREGEGSLNGSCSGGP
ncbi:hypothetical protein MC885_004932 [Smutsia gigantea]|nr:hypothetical protein MC885_004932 [Smutsia gigantea]